MKPPFNLSSNGGLFSAACVMEIQIEVVEVSQAEEVLTHFLEQGWVILFFFKASQLFRFSDGQAVGILLFLLFIIKVIHHSLPGSLLFLVLVFICQSFIIKNTASDTSLRWVVLLSLLCGCGTEMPCYSAQTHAECLCQRIRFISYAIIRF